MSVQALQYEDPPQGMEHHLALAHTLGLVLEVWGDKELEGADVRKGGGGAGGEERGGEHSTALGAQHNRQPIRPLRTSRRDFSLVGTLLNTPCA